MERDYTVSKLINNNIVFSSDDNGKEIILFGKAIGFGKKRGDRIPEESVLRVFKAVNSRERNFLINLVEDIDSVYIDLSSEIISLFEQKSQVKVNDIMMISLSDHLSNAIQNKSDGLEIPLDILPQLIAVYPQEFSIAQRGLELVRERTGVCLGPDEAGYIVLHYINCQGKDYRGDGKYRLLFQNQMIENIERYYQITLDRDSFYYHRFLSHLSFLAARIHDGQLPADHESIVYDLLIEKYPDLENCVEQSAQTIQTQFHVEITCEEKGYLAMHIANMLKAIRKEGTL